MNIVSTIKKHRGPLGTVYSCPHCHFTVKVPAGGRGRGYGLATASIARAEVTRHIKAVHGTASGLTT
tara:strand:- start:1243 stop:1443 length:201 start_codon:yes stop_codon:yes gene_type:complete